MEMVEFDFLKKWLRIFPARVSVHHELEELSLRSLARFYCQVRAYTLRISFPPIFWLIIENAVVVPVPISLQNSRSSTIVLKLWCGISCLFLALFSVPRGTSRIKSILLLAHVQFYTPTPVYKSLWWVPASKSVQRSQQLQSSMYSLCSGRFKLPVTLLLSPDLSLSYNQQEAEY